MTKEQALYSFFAKFLPAYEENSVPDTATYPYSTYTIQTDSWDKTVPISYNMFFRDDSWLSINAKFREFAEALPRGGMVIKCDNGALWLKRGTPFSQNMGDPNDDLVKRKYINIVIDFLTAD